MTTNKPEVKRYDCTSGGAQYCYGCYTMKEDELGDYVEWEAYEALQAECEALRKDAERYRWLRQRWGRVTETYDGDSGRIVEIGTEPAGEGWEIEPETLDAAIDAELAKVGAA